MHNLIKTTNIKHKHLLFDQIFLFSFEVLLRQIFRRSPIPYSVLLICFGMAIGAIFDGPRFEQYTALARIDPHLLLLVFLPILIFESAFTMDVHTFFKNSRQILTLAAPGLLISAFLTSCIARFIFSYNWSWPLSLVFGSVLSATDPVAVVAILKELGMNIIYSYIYS